ncbi:MAG: hypothetical protein IJ733_20160 [Lachnospiraceae bacterium]|nr:hypothetical protein [Lachnospiraceae bacterium]
MAPVAESKKVIRISENMVLISEEEYEGLLRAKENAEYLAKIDESREQLKNGNTISFTMEELKEMEADDWKPTQKVLDWMKLGSLSH